MKALLYALLFLLVMLAAALSAQLTVMVWEDVDVVVDEEQQTTNTTYRFTFSAQQPVGQLQGAVFYRAAPAVGALSNDIAAATRQLLAPLGQTNSAITVVLP